jgi:hypothetical protein
MTKPSQTARLILIQSPGDVGHPEVGFSRCGLDGSSLSRLVFTAHRASLTIGSRDTLTERQFTLSEAILQWAEANTSARPNKEPSFLLDITVSIAVDSSSLDQLCKHRAAGDHPAI